MYIYIHYSVQLRRTIYDSAFDRVYIVRGRVYSVQCTMYTVQCTAKVQSYARVEMTSDELNYMNIFIFIYSLIYTTFARGALE